ncbi:hypothetical protein SAMN05660748_3700 [Blastococcus aggregatus]|uniref:Uncharacterized protein n=1 Tax=Blastococcus aggregatus TaxID=38502 RepID=A0A285VEN5_9ACTN|nr:hypothetical protein SAMN05660748_3700 [Blastococcus aggregatus]
MLRTLSSGVNPGPWPQPYPTTVETAIEWQKTGVHATWSEMHGATHGLPKGRLSELIGRVAATGEQLGLAWTCEQDMRLWLDPSAPTGDRRSTSARALAEITGYYAISAGHGLANVTLRTLLVHPDAAAIINKDNKSAQGFAPFSSVPAVWVPLNEKVAKLLKAAALPVGQPSVDRMVDYVLTLTGHPHWQALTSRRHVDFHRWRPQSVVGGVATHNPWEEGADGSSTLTMYGSSQHQPPETQELIDEASAGLAVLAETMADWMAAWPAALRELGVPVFKEEA